MKIKGAFFIFLIFLFFCSNVHSQSGMIKLNDSCCRILSEDVTSTNKKLTTFFSQCQSGGIITIFSIVNDTLDGNYYEYYPSGVLKCWYVFEMGRFMELKVLSDSSGNLLCPGTLKNGYGYINSYEYFNQDNTIEVKNNVQSRMYFENGLYVGIKEFLDDVGNVTSLYDCDCSDVYYRMLKEYYDDNKDIITYIPYRICYEDTLLVLLKNKIVGSKIPLSKWYEDLPPDKLYIPSFYQTKENIDFLKKVKRKLMRLYRKENKTRYNNYIKRNLVID